MWKQSYLDGGNPWGAALDFSRHLPFQKNRTFCIFWVNLILLILFIQLSGAELTEYYFFYSENREDPKRTRKPDIKET